MKQKQWSRDPTLLRGLQYFEAVARHGSVALAAAEIGVSASAISHRLRELGTALGEDLVTRNGRGIALTEVGRRLAEHLAESFAGIDALVTGVVGAPRSRLRLAVCSAFGPAWLVPRLPDFQKSHPDIALDLRLYSHDPEQTQTVADALVTALPTKPGYKSIPLFDEMLVAVHAPGPHRARAAITTDPEDRDLGQDWHGYCEATGLHLDSVAEGDFLRCSHYLLAVELAKAGLGVALVPDFLAQDPVAQGSLIYFDPARIANGRSYRLCFKEALSDDPRVRSLARWLKANVGGKVLRFPQAGRQRP